MQRHPILMILLLTSLAALSCNGPTHTEADAAADGSPCAARSQGAEIVIEVNTETFRLWSTNGPFIDQAKKNQASKKSATALFNKVIAGADCDAQWAFHVEASDMSWPDLTTEVCDGRPSDIQRDPEHWISSVQRWCPWSAKVVAVEDRR